jgi:hypothetical protein
MSHSLDWGQYGSLQLGDFNGAKSAVASFEEMAEKTKHARAASGAALTKARYIVETEEWKVQPVAENASNETLFANGLSAVKTNDMATAEKMRDRLDSKAPARMSAPSASVRGGADAHADHGAVPPAPAPSAVTDGGKSIRIMERELTALIVLSKGQTDAAIAALKEAVQIEETMRPPNGSADPIKPSHELLGEVLLQAGRHAEAADAFDACLVRMPNRAHSLRGSARAHAAAGHKDVAAQREATLRSFWKGR